MTEKSSSHNVNEAIHEVGGGLRSLLGGQTASHFFNFFKNDEEPKPEETTSKKELNMKRKKKQVQNGGVKKKKKKKLEHKNEITKSEIKDEKVVIEAQGGTDHCKKVGEKPGSDFSSLKPKKPKKKRAPRDQRKTFKDEYKKIAVALEEEETKNKPNRNFAELMSDKSHRGGRKEKYNRKKLQKIRQANARAQ